MSIDERLRPHRGAAARGYLSAQLGLSATQLEIELSRLDPETTFALLLEFIQGVEELINLTLLGFEDPDTAQELAFKPLRPNAGVAAEVRKLVLTQYHPGIAQRAVGTVETLALYAVDVNRGERPDPLLQTGLVGAAAMYLQQRRRLLVSLLYAVPNWCKGKVKLPALGAARFFLELVDGPCSRILDIQHQMMLAHTFDGYWVADLGVVQLKSHEYQPLDDLALEPERLSVMDMFEAGSTADYQKEPEPIDHVFSPQEIRNQIRIMKAAFDEFDLQESEYSSLTDILEWSLNYLVDGYRISINVNVLERQIFERAASGWVRAWLVHESGGLLDSINVFCPFVRVNDDVISTLPLLTRFINHARHAILRRKRRYQIRSGFIFEALVKQKLVEMNFRVENTKRINRKEFDVIAWYEDVLVNIQCKNNEVDLTRVESQPEVFARFVRGRNRYYLHALQKEASREQLLINKFKPAAIAHLVLTKSEVPGSDPRVLAFSKIEQVPQMVRALAS